MLTEQDFARVESRGARVIEGTAQPNAIRIAARHQGRAGSGAHRLRDVEVGEFRALGGESVKVGRPDILRAKTTYIAVTEIIREDKNDVG